MRDSPIRHKYHVHASNAEAFQKIKAMTDDKGRPAFKPSIINLANLIASFPRDKGCFMGRDSIAKEMGGRICTKTIKRHEAHLHNAGIISIYKETIEGRTRITRRLITPRTDIVKCAYKEVYMTKKEDVFLSQAGDKMSSKNGQNVPHPLSKMSPYIESMTFRSNIRNFTTKPPFGDEEENEEEKNEDKEVCRPSGGGGGGIRRPQFESLRPRKDENIISSKEQMENNMPKKKAKKKSARTQRERMAEAIQKHNNGHIVNPLGGPDVTVRRFKPKMAKDIDVEGTVTAAQLYKFLYNKYQDAHGISIEPQLPPSKYAVTAWFDKICQKFLKNCSYQPTYRELSDYFSWIMEPQRLKKIIGASGEPGKASFLKIQQIEGAVYIRTFYDDKLRHKNKNQVPEMNPKILKSQKFAEEFREICETISDSLGDPRAVVYCISRFGMPLVVQCMRDRHGMSEMQCKKTIIEYMVEYLKKAKNIEPAIEFLKLSLESAEAKEYMYNSETVWIKWREICPPIIDEAVERYKKEYGGQEN